MSSLANLHLQSNTKVNFTDAIYLPMQDCCVFINLSINLVCIPCLRTVLKLPKMPIVSISIMKFHCKKIYQICAGYFTDDVSDELSINPTITTCLEKKRLASQPAISRFGSRLDKESLEQFHKITSSLRKRVYSVTPAQRVLLDLDSTLLPTYSRQEGEAFNYHYSAHGYHPWVCYDGLTGDLLKIEIRKGSTYSSTGVVQLMNILASIQIPNYFFAEIAVLLRQNFTNKQNPMLVRTTAQG